MRLGIFGGSFDPVHLGHLLLAEYCREVVPLDEVWFAPAAVSPHKQDQPPTSAEDRIAMLQLAIGGYEPFSIFQDEIDRGGVSYTVDTLDRLQQKYPESELFFLMGTDSLETLPDWHDPGRICELATIVVVDRAGEAEPNFNLLDSICSPEQVNDIREHWVRMGLVDFSSSEIRHRVGLQKSIRFQVPAAVEMYIHTHRLYYPSPSPEANDEKDCK